MKFYIRLLVALGLINLTYADCNFSVVNYTNYPISVTMGWYQGVESTVTVKPVSTMQLTLKSINNCTSSSAFGSGLAYLKFPADPQQTRINYIPEQNSLRIGALKPIDPNGTIIRSDDQHQIWLNRSKLTIDSQNITIYLDFVQRNGSKISGTF
ncbi:MAG: hypothetical protein RLZZ293_382 [Pseudomonadota bacterium]|jgi:hypothetical protein